MRPTIFLLVALLLSFDANAAMWQLINSDFRDGSFFCTYRFQQYEITIVQKQYCAAWIER